MSRVRDIAPYGVRMPADLKERLEFEAKSNGRSLNNEIVSRLKKSLEAASQSPENGYTLNKLNNFAYWLSESEKHLLSEFRKMHPGKQLALLELLK